MPPLLSRFTLIGALLIALLDPLSAQLVSFSPSQDSASLAHPGNPPAAAVDDDRSVSWKKLIPNTIEDQKTIYFDFPRSLFHGRHWIPTTAFLAATGVLIGIDQYESPYFRRTTSFHGFNNAFSGTNSSLIIAAVPAATYLTGLFRSNSYAQSTALWTAEAVADSEILTEILKVATRRARPESIQPSGNFGDTWTDSHTTTDGGFPSGHSIAAFSVATIMSRRYGRDHKWVPYVAYGVAGTIGFSRVTLSAHNVSDVAAGAALGYVISRFVVLGHNHR